MNNRNHRGFSLLAPSASINTSTNECAERHHIICPLYPRSRNEPSYCIIASSLHACSSWSVSPFFLRSTITVYIYCQLPIQHHPYLFTKDKNLPPCHQPSSLTAPMEKQLNDLMPSAHGTFHPCSPQSLVHCHDTNPRKRRIKVNSRLRVPAKLLIRNLDVHGSHSVQRTRCAASASQAPIKMG